MASSADGGQYDGQHVEAVAFEQLGAFQLAKVGLALLQALIDDAAGRCFVAFGIERRQYLDG